MNWTNSYGALGPIGVDSSGSILISNDDTVGYINMAQQQNYAVVTSGSTWTNLLGQYGQQAYIEPTIKKAMSLIESLRDEMSNWHGSLGVL